MVEIPTLETARLRLRPYRPGDFDAYAAMWADADVVRFIGGKPFSREQAWTRFLRQIGMWQHVGFGFFLVEDKKTGAFGGEVGFHELRRNISPAIEGTMEAGWVLTAPSRGQGLAEEAMQAALGWAASHGTGDRLTCLIDPGNHASLRLAGKLGFSEFARSTYNGMAIVLYERPRRAAICAHRSSSMSDTTINADEVEKFGGLAEEWWDPKGKFHPIHKFNPVRLAYIRDAAIAHFGRDGATRRPFEGLRVLDIGCGGGLLCEPLSRLGATVVGADAAERNIAVAKLHAGQSGLSIDYRATTAEALAGAGERFDIVLSMEVIEHVDNVPLFVRSCAALVAPGGLLFTATINRTLRARALAIFAAENVLRWLPRGTHDFAKFLTPDEIRALLTRNGLKITDQTGVVYHPLADAWRLSPDTGINYMVLAEKPKASTGD